MRQIRLLLSSALAFALAIMAGCGSSSSAPASGPATGGGVTQTYSLGGSVSGLGGASGLQLTDGVEIIQVDATAATFSFPTRLQSGTEYAVSVAAQPVGKTCSVAGGTGTIAAADTANVVVTCADQAFHIGGPIQGLSVSGLVVTNGGDTLAIDAGATTFTMPGAVAVGSSYAVTVQTQPDGLACVVTNGSGVLSAGDVTAISITCTDRSFALGGTITGLGNNSGLVLANGSDTLNVDAGASSFTMPGAVAYGAAYSVTVQQAPAGLTCTISQGSGSMPASDLTNVVVACADQSYDVGGSIHGLTVSGLVLANGPDTLSIQANASSFTMPTPVAFGSNYDLVVQAQPANFTCTVSDGSGTMGADPVTAVSITCAQTAFTLGGTIDGLTTNGLVLSNGSETLTVLANASTFTMPSAVATGASYNISVVSSPVTKTCTVLNGSGVMGDGPAMGVSVTCGPGAVSELALFAGAPGPSSPNFTSLIQGRDGNLYGTTPKGGAYDAGAVFKLTPAGELTVLWSFGAGSDGWYPYSSLIQARDGNFYGTTLGGGAFSNGTVFKLTPAGEETVLWSFRDDGQGAWPIGGLLESKDGNFYGVTMFGGTDDVGTVFRITPAGELTTFTPFFRWNGGPYTTESGGLAQDAAGNLYVLAAMGGAYGGGAVVKITVDGDQATSTFTSLGSASAAGVLPVGNLIAASDGNFYGATANGGAANLGTVFKMTPAGEITTLYSFQGGQNDGSHPTGPLIQGNDGNLYGFTSNGGAGDQGTLFQVTLTGEETLQFSFSITPIGGLLQAADGTLYGMLSHGLGSVLQVK
ncbi:choice-of-anchor tandem repeat GloVer-containing protein [Peristeroidobacter soli]|uniref:choice-of-anchor tandem repeat GloVer-containing protein n=1 Tax=Peristeroidobacter soli TaxID=2497877 RepID=UPI00101DE294|nr:choice-of-anchor tandem repeat GloVer-containing protein [Peristeroidobacter soli]